MTPDEVAQAQSAIAASEARAIEAERQRDEYKRERDEARAILARLRTSLSEQFNDPGAAGQGSN